MNIEQLVASCAQKFLKTTDLKGLSYLRQLHLLTQMVNFGYISSEETAVVKEFLERKSAPDLNLITREDPEVYKGGGNTSIRSQEIGLNVDSGLRPVDYEFDKNGELRVVCEDPDCTPVLVKNHPMCKDKNCDEL